MTLGLLGLLLSTHRAARASAAAIARRQRARLALLVPRVRTVPPYSRALDRGLPTRVTDRAATSAPGLPFLEQRICREGGR